jgi:hypothetical protein
LLWCLGCGNRSNAHVGEIVREVRASLRFTQSALMSQLSTVMFDVREGWKERTMRGFYLALAMCCWAGGGGGVGFGGGSDAGS